ncbi:AEC family transporter [Colwellia sp. MB3u-70]|uniref:AEC family transporter n=1 Tax=unclassified Colwellia TaxID=196834 RepID=UPI0015F4078A|nr:MULTISPECIES: AEC family transporter [unclassified Colwellia]MBA6291596.1 AEC family transporter [Colwellia sp. MB3u-8]MBA6305658.1 AEC family transporter [Colwellia sp. MB3u-70]
MTLFFIILIKIFPLYINVILGFLSSKILHVQRESIAALLIYILGPIVVFSAVITVKIDFSVAILPIFLYVFCSILAFASLFIWGKSWDNPTGNILAFSAGTGNTGYFGIPLAIILFPPTLADIYIFAVIASLLYESSTGFYVTAKGNFSVKQSLKKISRLPILYAFILGITCNFAGLKIPEEISAYTAQFKGAYGILGMMMLGMGLLGLKSNPDNFDKKFISITFIIKFVFWPLAMLGFIYVDKTYLHFLNEDLYKVLFLFSIVPLAGNTVTLAVLLNAKPEKASLAVFLSTLVSIIFIPLAIYLYGGF